MVYTGNTSGRHRSGATAERNGEMAVTKEAEEIARVGARLRQERLQRGLSINEVAKRANLTKGFISQLERGETSASLG